MGLKQPPTKSKRRAVLFITCCHIGYVGRIKSRHRNCWAVHIHRETGVEEEVLRISHSHHLSLCHTTTTMSSLLSLSPELWTLIAETVCWIVHYHLPSSLFLPLLVYPSSGLTGPALQRSAPFTATESAKPGLSPLPQHLFTDSISPPEHPTDGRGSGAMRCSFESVAGKCGDKGKC